VRLIAFYLPQFHENEINNKNWGKGFTEWTNVKKSIPLYYGHHQPRLPTELGYYDLNNDEARHQQAKLAKEYGIDAWCYYYYRFNGQRVLEMPLSRHIQDKSLDMPFLICWANENWTRTWDGLDKEILLKQEHSVEDDLNFIKDISQTLIDPRYVRIDNKPVILIYRTELWEDISKTAQIWRDYMLKYFNTGLYLIRCNSFDQKTDPRKIGFDASYQFPPSGAEARHFNSKEFNGNFGDYVRCKHMSSKEYNFKVFRGIMTGFDNSPRRKNNVGIFLNNSPVLYGEWLKEAIEYTIKNFEKQERLIFINAWNEWGEGAILEPCDQWGKRYLEATLEARRILNV
jgi:lipopolysaccharide biosynthesis protein